MRATLGVNAFIAEAQPFDGPSSDQMLRDDLFRILGLDVAVPNGFRVNHNHRTVLALVQAASLVDANATHKPGSFRKLLELRKQLALAVAGAGWPGSTLGTNIVTNKQVTFKWRQNEKILQLPSYLAAIRPLSTGWDALKPIRTSHSPIPSETMESELWIPITS